MLKLYNVGIFLSGKGISWDESGDRKLDKERNREEETSETSHNVDEVIKGKKCCTRRFQAENRETSSTTIYSLKTSSQKSSGENRRFRNFPGPTLVMMNKHYCGQTFQHPHVRILLSSFAGSSALSWGGNRLNTKPNVATKRLLNRQNRAGGSKTMKSHLEKCNLWVQMKSLANNETESCQKKRRFENNLDAFRQIETSDEKKAKLRSTLRSTAS